MPASEDLEIVRKVQAGEGEAYGGIVRRHQARLIRLCSSFLKNHAEAEDAAQEIFVKAFRRIGDFRQNASFSTWLYRIASNHCLSLLRSRRPTESLDDFLDEIALPSSSDPRRVLENRDFTDQILSRLPEQYRLALTLREVEGLSYLEIAEVMDTSLDSVKALLRRARQEIEEKLRHFLKKECV